MGEHEINGATEKLEHTNLELRSQSELLTENHQLLQKKYALVLADQKSSENVLVSAKENHVQEIAKKNMELQNMRALILKEHELEMNANYLKLKNAEEKVKVKQISISTLAMQTKINTLLSEKETLSQQMLSNEIENTNQTNLLLEESRTKQLTAIQETTSTLERKATLSQKEMQNNLTTTHRNEMSQLIKEHEAN